MWHINIKKILKLRHNYNSPRLTEKLFELLLTIAEADSNGRGVENCELCVVFSEHKGDADS